MHSRLVPCLVRVGLVGLLLVLPFAVVSVAAQGEPPVAEGHRVDVGRRDGNTTVSGDLTLCASPASFPAPCPSEAYRANATARWDLFVGGSQRSADVVVWVCVRPDSEPPVPPTCLPVVV